MLETDGLGGRLSFVFYSDLTPQQVSDAYAAMGETAKAVLNYCTYLYAQLASKRARPALYQSTMPDSIWEETLEFEISEAAALRHAVFVFDAQAGVWGRVHKSEEHTSELQSLMRISYAVFCLHKKTQSYHTI